MAKKRTPITVKKYAHAVDTETAIEADAGTSPRGKTKPTVNKRTARPTNRVRASVRRPNINGQLLTDIAPELDKYDCRPEQLADVLLPRISFEARQARAITFITDVLTKHGKRNILHYLSDLAEVEQRVRALQPRQRDHVVHAVRTFLLGVFLNERLLGGRADALQCKLAFLLHDVGYPLEIAARVGEPFGNRLNEIADEIGVEIVPVRFIAPQLADIERLTQGNNSIDLIQKRLAQWGLDIDVNSAYEESAKKGTVCHGVISALAILRVLDMLYQKNNGAREHIEVFIKGVDWNQTYFEQDNLSACAAIFLHNLKPKWFTATKIQRELAPVAFLLRLADALQEWERPSGNDHRGFPPSLFNIEVANGQLSFRSGIPDRRKAAIWQDIQGVLDARDIEIT